MNNNTFGVSAHTTDATRTAGHASELRAHRLRGRLPGRPGGGSYGGSYGRSHWPARAMGGRRLALLVTVATGLAPALVWAGAGPAAQAAGVSGVAGVAQSASAGASAQAAGSSTEATGAPNRRPDRRPDRRPGSRGGYDWSRVAPQRLPDGSSSTASTAVGIDDSGRVAGNAAAADGASRPFVGGDWGARWLESGSGGVLAAAIAPRGTVAGKTSGGPDAQVVTWSRSGRASTAQAPESRTGFLLGAVNSRGVVAGSLDFNRVTYPFYGVPGSLVQVPTKLLGSYTVSGLSETGLAAATVTAPVQPQTGTYPVGVVFTGKGVTPVRSGSTSTLDAISPDGRRLVGRVGATGRSAAGGRLAWLSTTRNPVPLSGTGGLRVAGVSDAGVLVGSAGGRAGVWRDGRLTDLNTRVRGLPRGWVLTDAVAINKSGALAVNATDGRGNTVALKLAPSRR